MPNVYIHYFGDESSKSLLEYYGVENYQQAKIDALRGKHCPNCSEPCMPEGGFSPRCRMVLTYDAYSETIEEKKQKQSEVNELKVKYEQDMKVMRQEIRRDERAISTIGKSAKARSYKRRIILGQINPTTIVEAILFNVIRVSSAFNCYLEWFCPIIRSNLFSHF
jgi:hypothetical protein